VTRIVWAAVGAKPDRIPVRDELHHPPVLVDQLVVPVADQHEVVEVGRPQGPADHVMSVEEPAGLAARKDTASVPVAELAHEPARDVARRCPIPTTRPPLSCSRSSTRASHARRRAVSGWITGPPSISARDVVGTQRAEGGVHHH
jgi:hypothetical protein